MKKIMNFKRTAAIFMASVFMISSLAGCGKTGGETEITTTSNAGNTSKISGEFNLFTWDGMFPQEVLNGFEKEFGVKINYANFDYDEDMLAKLETAKGGEYDLVIADDYIIELAIQEGLVQKLDKAKLSNYQNIDPVFQSKFYDVNNEYTVPYGAGIPLIIYDPAQVEIEITGYEDLWDASLVDNIALLGNYRVINGMVLKTMGKSFNEKDPAVLDEMKAKLLTLAPNIRLINDNNTQDFIISGEAAVGFLYTSQITMAVAARPDLKVVYPKEGMGFGIMNGFIPSQAPNSDAAHAFLDYILRPEIAAKCFESIGYVCTNKAAVEFMSEEAQKTLAMPEGSGEGEFVMDIGAEANEIHEKIWTEFKATLD